MPTIATVKPYTPLELAGRDIYLAEGCYNCHSQMIRPILSETKRYGEYSKPGEFVYDHPFQWGSRRIGPDLAREGRQAVAALARAALRGPGQVTQGSIMPPYPWLLDKPLDFDVDPARMKAMQTLGVPYTDEEIRAGSVPRNARPKEIADKIAEAGGRGDLADKQVVALIAYVDRLGVDLFATPEARGADRRRTANRTGVRPRRLPGESAAESSRQNVRAQKLSRVNATGCSENCQ